VRTSAPTSETERGDLDLAQLRDFCSQHLATFKIPRDIRVVDELPRNAMGRVVKASLREALAAAAEPSRVASERTGHQPDEVPTRG
jgi:acyl-CoA synthetase (AMP-forming)/AMP-acid ligase II